MNETFGAAFGLFLMLVAVVVVFLEVRNRAPRRPQQQAQPVSLRRQPQEHLLRLDGIECRALDAGVRQPKVVLSGRSVRHWGWHDGDRLVIRTPGGFRSTYRIERLLRPGGDVYFAECIFCPGGPDHFEGA